MQRLKEYARNYMQTVKTPYPKLKNLHCPQCKQLSRDRDKKERTHREGGRGDDEEGEG